jgi:hypothetical protein
MRIGKTPGTPNKKRAEIIGRKKRDTSEINEIRAHIRLHLNVTRAETIIATINAGIRNTPS